MRHGLCCIQWICASGLPQQTQDPPSYHFVRIVRTMPPFGAALIWVKHF
jgi:hypothetical protein